MNAPRRVYHRAAVGATALLLAASLSGCTAGHTAAVGGRAPGDDSLTVATVAAPASLDFTTTAGAAIPQALMANVYEGLVRIDASGNVVPHLARSWDVSAGGRVYTFSLRDDVTFSNGDAFTAETAKFSLDRVRSDAWTNGLKKSMDVVSDTRVLSPTTLQVTLSRPANSWLWSLGTLVGAMMTPNGVDELATRPVGTGPYVVDAWAVGEELSFRARPDYWGDAPQHEHARLRYYPEAISATNALRTGDADVVWNMTAFELLDTLPSEIAVHVGSTNGELLLSMNHRRPTFADVRVRQAVMYAIDRQAIIDTVFEGYATNTGGVPAPPTDPWYFVSDRYPYQPERARELLAAADSPTPEITLAVPSLPYAQATAEVLYSQLSDVGFSVTLEFLEFPAVWLHQVMQQRDYDMSLIAHVEARDIPAIFGSPDYYLGYDSPDVRSYLLKADSGPAALEAPRMRRAIEQILADAAADTLLNTPNIVLTAPGVTGINANVVTDALPLAPISRGGGD